MNSKTIFAMTAAILGSISSAALAADQPLLVEGQRATQERVSFADLDLRNSADRSALRQRVWSASDRVCVAAEGPMYRDNIAVVGYSANPGLNCAELTYADARPQMRSAIATARSGSSMAAATIVLSVRRAR